MSGATQLREAAEQIAAETPDIVWRVSHESLASALVAALADLTVIEKGQTANLGTYSYTYADLATIVKRTRPALARHGIVALTPLCSLGADPACSVVLVHEGGESMTFGPFPFQHGRDAQATGSWVTYMRRYALVAALGMAAGDDDDGAAAQPRQAPVKVEPHPLRAKAAELDDDGKVWAFFLSRAGVADQDADALLTEDEGWRRWLSEGIAAHLAAGGDPPKEQDAET